MRQQWCEKRVPETIVFPHLDKELMGQRDFSFESRRKAGRHGNPYGTEPFKIMRPDPFDLTPGWQPTAGRGHALDAP